MGEASRRCAVLAVRFWCCGSGGAVHSRERHRACLAWGLGSVEWIVWDEFVSLMGYLEGRDGEKG